jgi:hypothetical protein
MDRRVILLFAVVVIASGCADSSEGSGTGVVVEDFSIADTSLSPNQETSIETTIANYNTGETTVSSEDVMLFNTGQLQVLDGSKQCNPDEINAASEGITPTMRCMWNVKAPGESFVEGFQSKPLSIKMQLSYSSSVDNRDPLKMNFKQLSNIEESSEISRSTNNGDVKLSISSESPTATGTPQKVDIKAVNIGPGDIVGEYSFDYAPSGIFEDCPESESPIQGEVEFSCSVSSDSTGVRNVFVSTSYKYKKSPNLDIRIVNN